MRKTTTSRTMTNKTSTTFRRQESCNSRLAAAPPPAAVSNDSSGMDNATLVATLLGGAETTCRVRCHRDNTLDKNQRVGKESKTTTTTTTIPTNTTPTRHTTSLRSVARWNIANWVGVDRPLVAFINGVDTQVRLRDTSGYIGSKNIKTNHTPPPALPLLPPETVADRACALFGKQQQPDFEDSIRLLPCLSARLFACWMLRQEKFSATNNTENCLLLPWLQALVDLELVTLGANSKHVDNDNNDKRDPLLEKPNRVVHFPGFDGSAMKPPVDDLLGSDDHGRDCLNKLHATVQEAQRQQQQLAATNDFSKVSLAQLESLIDFLKHLSEEDARACSTSIGESGRSIFATRRVFKAAQFICNDLEILASRSTTPDCHHGKTSLWVERRLADSCGQMVRYLLRTMFNPPTTRAHFGPQEEDLQPRILDRVSLRFGGEDNDENEEDDDDNRDEEENVPLSSLVSHAFRCIHELLGPNALVDTADVISAIASTDPTTNDGDDKWEIAQSKLYHISAILNAYEGARFLHQLLASVPVTQDYACWSDISHYASMMVPLRHDDDCNPHRTPKQPHDDCRAIRCEDVHLIILGQASPSVLMDHLTKVRQSLEPVSRECHAHIEAIVAKFQLTKHKRRRRSSIDGRRTSSGHGSKTAEESLEEKRETMQLDILKSLVREVRESAACFPRVKPRRVKHDDEPPSTPPRRQYQVSSSPESSVLLPSLPDQHISERQSEGICGAIRRSPRLSKKRKSIEAPARLLSGAAGEEDNTKSSEGLQPYSPSMLGASSLTRSAVAQELGGAAASSNRKTPQLSRANNCAMTPPRQPMTKTTQEEDAIAWLSNLGGDDSPLTGRDQDVSGRPPMLNHEICSMSLDEPNSTQPATRSTAELPPQASPGAYSGRSEEKPKADLRSLAEMSQSSSTSPILGPKVLHPSSPSIQSDSLDTPSTPPRPLSPGIQVNDENNCLQTPKPPKKRRRSVVRRGLKDTPNKSQSHQIKRPRLSSLVNHSSMAFEKPLQLPPSTSAVNDANVVNRACHLFPEQAIADGIRELPCVSARLFACFSLRQDTIGSDVGDKEAATDENPMSNNTLTPMTRRRKSLLLETTVPPTASVLEPLLPLLKVLVELELMTLSAGIVELDSGDLDNDQTKKVHFAGFDGSSMKPPVDVLPGSDSHQHECMKKLQLVLEEAHRLQLETGPTLSSTTAALEALVSYLKCLSDDDAQACARSMQEANSFPMSRVLKAADLYRYDLEILGFRLLADSQANQQLEQPSDSERRPKLLLLEQRLADSCGQFIRHYLRSIFNPIPSRARIMLASPEKYPRRISEILVLQSLADPTEAVDDGSLSSLISYALRDVHEALGSLAILGDSGDVGATLVQRLVARTIKPYDVTVMSKLQGFFESTGGWSKCSSDASNGDNFTDQEWDGVFSYVRQLGEAVAAFHGARFLHELWTAPGVADSLLHGDQSKSWLSLQLHASILSKGIATSSGEGLSQTWAKAEDAHLSVLGQLSSNLLFEHLGSVMRLLEPHIEEWENRLNTLVEMSSEAAKSCCAPIQTKSRRSSGRRSSIISPRKQSKATVFHSTHRDEFGEFATLVDEAKQRSVFFPRVLSYKGLGSADDDDDEIKKCLLDEEREC